ncbi:hypothetical protein BGZ61DRAFT_455975 [Ilyonectria robusta]|uniref:uncharacterized protein n=1 Tax=Ilyonectria robusta TaxID=1079257 RepID=UPI001E8CF40B|nr:uncharacterized protein BGZ61DRAFT_455975 [Ilyonectria robusta]KAH8683502.1 hypothetical protein BGZ61DRAFT_455975 [Ilyonectria robusta]
MHRVQTKVQYNVSSARTIRPPTVEPLETPPLQPFHARMHTSRSLIRNGGRSLERLVRSVAINPVPPPSAAKRGPRQRHVTLPRRHGRRFAYRRDSQQLDAVFLDGECAALLTRPMLDARFKVRGCLSMTPRVFFFWLCHVGIDLRIAVLPPFGCKPLGVNLGCTILQPRPDLDSISPPRSNGACHDLSWDQQRLGRPMQDLHATLPRSLDDERKRFPH